MKSAFTRINQGHKSDKEKKVRPVLRAISSNKLEKMTGKKVTTKINKTLVARDENNKVESTEDVVEIDWSLQDLFDRMAALENDNTAFKAVHKTLIDGHKTLIEGNKALDRRVSSLEKVLQVHVGERHTGLVAIHRDMKAEVSKLPNSDRKLVLEELLLKMKSEHARLAKHVLFSASEGSD